MGIRIKADSKDLKGDLIINTKDMAKTVILGLMQDFDIDSDELIY